MEIIYATNKQVRESGEDKRRREKPDVGTERRKEKRQHVSFFCLTAESSQFVG